MPSAVPSSGPSVGSSVVQSGGGRFSLYIGGVFPTTEKRGKGKKSSIRNVVLALRICFSYWSVSPGWFIRNGTARLASLSQY
jgi:hypothetical protein